MKNLSNLQRSVTAVAAAVMMLFCTVGVFAQQVLPKPPKVDRYEFKTLPSMAPETDASYNVIKQDFFLTMRDGIKLDCSKFFPDQPNQFLPNGYPVVIMVHGYGDSKTTLEQFARDQAQFNYVVYTLSIRGQGLSEGLSNLISTTEAEDLKEFVNYVKRDVVGGDSTKIMIMGGSQGGTLPYMAAARGMKVAGIVSALTSPQFATSWIENGSVKMTFLWTIEYTPDTARYTPQVDRMSDWVYATGVKSNKWDSLAKYVPLNRDFNTYVNNNTVPILIENSWQDYFFNARQGISTFSSLTFPTRVYLGAVMGHGGDISSTENAWHMNFFNEFFFNYAWNQDQSFPTRPKYHFAYTTFPRVGQYWDFKHDSSAVWPPAGVTYKKLYLKNDHDLEVYPEFTDRTVSLKNQVANGYTLQNAVLAEFKGTDFNNKFKKDSVWFETNPLDQPVRMVGTPKITFQYSSSADICQFNVQLFEVSSTGDVKFINRINYTDRNYIKNQKKTATVEGLSHAHLFSTGSKLRVVITNLDRTNDDVKFLGTNPHVLPVMANGTSTIYLKNSYIELPLNMNGVASTGSWLSNLLGWLFQNYPNPFNPTTTISFEIPQAEVVTLKIYDIAGREVATLLNTSLKAGVHQVNWDATRFSSGVYFSKLIVGGKPADIKRMLLIK
jgi:predicted acyl esterase